MVLRSPQVVPIPEWEYIMRIFVRAGPVNGEATVRRPTNPYDDHELFFATTVGGF